MSGVHRGSPIEAELPTGLVRPAKGQDDGGGLARLVVATDPTAPLAVNLVLAAGTVFLRSDKDVDFIGALLVNAFENANLIGLPANSVRIKSVALLSDQRLAWEVQLYSRDTFGNVDADLDTFLESIPFGVSDGQQVAGAGLFKYAMTGLDIPYEDLDATTELHVALGTRAGAKNAGAAGEVVVVFGIEA
jgi:hypothetical protein